VLFELGNSGCVCVCVCLFAVVLDGSGGEATLDGPGRAANAVAGAR
jgi:hypothetical protein